MQLPLTSLVPTIVEIVQFIESNWPHVWWFPKWYLGVPLRFVTGPVVPTLTIEIHKFTGITIAGAYLAIICLLWLAGSIGFLYLVKELGGAGKLQWMVFLLFLLMPVHLLLLSYGNGLHHLTISLLPLIILTWFKALNRWNLIWSAILIFLISATLLIDVGGMLAIVVAGVAVILVGARHDWIASGVKSTLILLVAFSFATIWYTPRFWWIILGNPSFGGKPLSNVIPFVLQLLQALIPLFLGALFVQKRYRLTDKLTQFGVLFGASFLFLTLIRMLSDVDFWMDWTSYLLELQLAMSLLLPIVLIKLVHNIRTLQIIILLTVVTLTIINVTVLDTLYKLNEKDLLYRQELKKIIKDHMKPDRRIFLSGSGVFWMGAEINNLLQVRGGKDEVSTHPTWAMGAYNIREGEDKELLENWLSAFGVSALLYHDETSVEFFKDFKNPQRFDLQENVISRTGNSLYAYKSTIARRADPKILDNAKPTKGNDHEALATYKKILGEPLEASYTNPQQLEITGIPPDGLISVAGTFDTGWQLREGEGKITGDSFGNMVIHPTQAGSILILHYQEGFFWLPGILMSMVSIGLLNQSGRIIKLFKQKAPSLVTETDEEKEY